MANALAQLSGTEQTLAALTEDQSEAEVAESRSAVTQAEVQFTAADRQAEVSLEALTEAFDDFCERYSGLSASDEAIRQTCASTLPLSDAQVELLRESFEDRSSTYESFGNSLIDANVARVGSAADRGSAQSALASAQERLAELLLPVAEDDLFQAERSIEAAKASHAAAVAKLEELRAAPGEDDVYQAQQTVQAAKSNHAAAVARFADLRAAPGEDEVFQAERAVEAARASQAAAVARLDDLRVVATEDEVFQALQAVEAAKASHAAAVARLDDLRAETDAGDIEQARISLESAQASLATAQARYNEVVAGPTANAIEQQRQEVRLAEFSVEEDRAALDNLTVFAPFDGVVEAVNVQPGDRITSGFAAFTLSTSSRMLISLAVTEEDLLELEVGQAGLATFDAIDGTEYPVRVASVSRVPNAEQGVVTYGVEARILAGTELAEVADQTPTDGARAGGAFRDGAFQGGQGGGFGGGASGGPFAGLELPEGVTIQQVRQALVSPGPLPEGVVLPEELQEMLQSFLASGGGGPGEGGPRDTAGQPVGFAARPLPAPGMSASVTILTEVREESVLVPVSAVRQLDGDWFVSIPVQGGERVEGGFERVFVEVGESDGENVEIAGGLENGAVVLIGADGAGVAFTATQAQPRANPGFGTGQGGFGPGGRQ